MAKIILISGKAEHGKTATARIIKERLESEGKTVTIVPFASYLKFVCKEYFGWNGKKDLDGRKILQHVGTDVVRKKDPDFWVERSGTLLKCSKTVLISLLLTIVGLSEKRIISQTFSRWMF